MITSRQIRIGSLIFVLNFFFTPNLRLYLCITIFRYIA